MEEPVFEAVAEDNTRFEKVRFCFPVPGGNVGTLLGSAWGWEGARLHPAQTGLQDTGCVGTAGGEVERPTAGVGRQGVGFRTAIDYAIAAKTIDC